MSAINSTVRFCPKCQTETERNKRGGCKACACIRGALWRKNNPEKVKMLGAKWRKENPEKHRANFAEWYKDKANKDKKKANKIAWLKANPNKRKEYSARAYAADPAKNIAKAMAWKRANPEKTKIQDTRFRENNKERLKEYRRAWHIAHLERENAKTAKRKRDHPEAVRINNQNRRALRKSAGGSLSHGLAAKLFKLQKGKCACCGLPLGDDYHLDHTMPLILGGSNTDGNIQLLRSICNMQKNKSHPVDFMQERGFLL